MIKKETVFTPDPKLPKEAYQDLENIWVDHEMHNGSYYKWNYTRDAERYPNVSKYLMDQGVSQCLIHNSW